MNLDLNKDIDKTSTNIEESQRLKTNLKKNKTAD